MADDETSPIPATFTPTEVATKLQCSARTLRSIARKHGCFTQIGRSMLFTVSDLEALLKAAKGKPKGEGRYIPRQRLRK
tara:strand:- start:1708 stop:1944 length:237 start_codon:yes stop_codon:yes gene_type:complete